MLVKLTKLKENLQDLTQEEAYEVFKAILEGKLSDIKAAAFLTAMRIKGETSEELLGVIKAIKERMNFPQKKENALDLSLNYDGKNRTVYILPSALWLCSRLGVEFTNHYALGAPTKEGVTLYEVVKELGVDINVSFVDQKNYAPELYKLMPLRRELGFRSLINTVEKFLNPFQTKKIVVSIFHKPYFDKNAELLELLGIEDYTIIKGLEGGIEPLPDRPTLVKRRGKDIESIEPKSLGLEMPKEVHSENVLRDSLEINRKIIDGRERGEFFNWALYTAGVLLYAAGECESVEEGVGRVAKEST
ncbi:anthranilate phosphoribosyltransferase [Hydrogenivirga caldilitoris]|uniref:Anthranilate phosphoribosyltransferase n=1 Tax=Hydrogenivirga caldilitoris TaxID=246264 RepID=A0A497XND1_9AQUI|nr:anthranilate phosphoribosyltransferase [Hydrogenivirga caldilitoris]RLJ70457.1 anthranilate phosphoribosyltransferase [Hydrogenivirga caldilitoris]